jgi:hypothetical protein
MQARSSMRHFLTAGLCTLAVALTACGGGGGGSGDPQVTSGTTPTTNTGTGTTPMNLSTTQAAWGSTAVFMAPGQTTRTWTFSDCGYDAFSNQAIPGLGAKVTFDSVNGQYSNGLVTVEWLGTTTISTHVHGAAGGANDASSALGYTTDQAGNFTRVTFAMSTPFFIDFFMASGSQSSYYMRSQGYDSDGMPTGSIYCWGAPANFASSFVPDPAYRRSTERLNNTDFLGFGQSQLSLPPVTETVAGSANAIAYPFQIQNGNFVFIPGFYLTSDNDINFSSPNTVDGTAAFSISLPALGGTGAIQTGAFDSSTFRLRTNPAPTPLNIGMAQAGSYAEYNGLGAKTSSVLFVPANAAPGTRYFQMSVARLEDSTRSLLNTFLQDIAEAPDSFLY